MNSHFNGYAVFFFPQALEALGKAVQPYLQDSPAGPHVLCREIDTGGSLIELTMDGKTPDGEPLDLELMVPTSMVRMIVSARADQSFGFGPRVPVQPVTGEAPVLAGEPGPAHGRGDDDAARPTRRPQPSPAGRAAGKASDAHRRPLPVKRAGKAAKQGAGKAGAKPANKAAAKKAAAKKAAVKKAAVKKAAARNSTAKKAGKQGAKPVR
jgi:hypothetical protein